MISVLITDDHPVTRKGLCSLLSSDPNIEVLAEKEGHYDTINFLETSTKQPNICLIDLSLQDSNGIKLIKEIKEKFPEIISLAISMYEAFQYAGKYLKQEEKVLL